MPLRTLIAISDFAHPDYEVQSLLLQPNIPVLFLF